MTVKLQPCAKAKVRFVDAAGKPQAGHSLGLIMLLAPDARAFLWQAGALGAWDAAGPSDKDCRQTVSGLIPGATYRYVDYKSKKEHEFTAEAGPGDFIYVPPYVPHQEINASRDEVLECVLVRSGQEPVVVNLDIEPAEPHEQVPWKDPIHR